MAGPDRHTASGVNPASDEAGVIADLLRPLAAAPERFDLFAALRLLESAYPNHPRLGEARRARDEPVRLNQPPHLHFPPAQIAGFRAGQGAASAVLTTYGFGLFGPQGPLPLHVTAEALSRLRHRHDPALAAFCDLFHHRLATLYYRAWANARPSVEHDRPNRDRQPASRSSALYRLYGQPVRPANSPAGSRGAAGQPVLPCARENRGVHRWLDRHSAGPSNPSRQGGQCQTPRRRCGGR